MGAIPAIHPRRNGHPDRAMPVAEREKRRQWPLRRIPPRMDQRAVPTPLPHVPGQLRWRPQPPPAKLRWRPQPPPTISTQTKNAVTPKSSPTNGTGPEQALYFTRSFSEPLLVIWCGNIIARDCCIARAGARARELAGRNKPLGNWDIINIRMVDIRRPDPKRDFAEGVSVWPEKNTEAMIDEVLAQVSAASVQKECFNNPVVEGTYFKEITWGAMPPLNKFPFLISYGDPAPSNRTTHRKGVKALGSFKSNVLLGILDGRLYVITAFLDHVTNDEFVNWYYYQKDYVRDRTTIYNYIENNKLQDPFYDQVFKPLFLQKAVERKFIISIAPDERAKPDKFARIEGNLEPLNRAGNLIFNIAEKENPHMQRLEEQFKLFDDGLPAPADGPDAVEGGYFVAQRKVVAITPTAWSIGTRPVNKKRY